MGSKNNPGRYDCYANALPDEPMFVLLARDPFASLLVQRWAIYREELIRADKKPASDRAMIREAWQCAENMVKWREANDGAWRLPAPPTDRKEVNMDERFERRRDNVMLERRRTGMPAQPATAESEADPSNPNAPPRPAHSPAVAVTDVELMILLAHEQGCSDYLGEGDVLCARECTDDPLDTCECLRIVRVLREAIEVAPPQVTDEMVSRLQEWLLACAATRISKEGARDALAAALGKEG